MAVEGIEALPPPAPPGYKYRGFQVEAIVKARTWKRMLLADEMGCVDGEAVLAINRAGIGKKVKIKDAYLRMHRLSRGNWNWREDIPTYCRALCDGELHQHRVIDIIDKGVRPVMLLTTVGGKSLKLTPDHEVARPNGEWTEASKLNPGDTILVNGKFVDQDGYVRVTEQHDHHRQHGGQVYEHILVMERHLGRLIDYPKENVHHINGDKSDNRIENLEVVTPREHKIAHKSYRWMEGGTTGNGGEIMFIPKEDTVLSVQDAGETHVYDLIMEDPHRNFVANGIIVHNCGKSIEAIGIINDNPDIRKVLIICPASLRPNWKREIIRWLVRRDVTIGIANTKRGFPRADIVIVNYEILKPFHRNIHETEWDLIIADECHYLKNGVTSRALEVLGRDTGELIKRRPKLEAKQVLFLTGTPIVNRPFELYPLVHYLHPEAFPDRKSFINKYCGGKVNGQKKSEIGEKSLRELHDKLSSTLMLRRLKEDVLTELPPKIRQVIVLPADQVKGAVRKEKEQFLKIHKELSILRMQAELAKCSDDDKFYNDIITRLHQVEFTTIQQITALRMQTALAKVGLVAEHAHNVLEQTPKLVIFGYHTAVLENLALEFGKACVVVHGKVNADERDRRITTFQTDKNCRVLLGSIRAVGVGHTMTAAQVAVFAELDWAPSVIDQAESRLHRIGQRGSVLIQHLVLDGSIDALLAQRLIEKQETITSALDDVKETRENLYALSRTKPFVEADRKEIHEIASKLKPRDISKIHDALETVVARGPKKSVSGLDYNLLVVLAQQEYLEPTQAALALEILRKYGGK